jgi:hypothetical protein
MTCKGIYPSGEWVISTSLSRSFARIVRFFLKRKNRRRYGDKRKAEETKKEGKKGEQIQKTFEEREGGESEHCTSAIIKRLISCCSTLFPENY